MVAPLYGVPTFSVGIVGYGLAGHKAVVFRSRLEAVGIRKIAVPQEKLAGAILEFGRPSSVAPIGLKCGMRIRNIVPSVAGTTCEGIWEMLRSGMLQLMQTYGITARVSIEPKKVSGMVPRFLGFRKDLRAKKNPGGWPGLDSIDDFSGCLLQENHLPHIHKSFSRVLDGDCFDPTEI